MIAVRLGVIAVGALGLAVWPGGLWLVGWLAGSAWALGWWYWREAEARSAAVAEMADRLRQEESIADAQAWLAAMQESALNMAEALNHASRLVHFSRSLNLLDQEALRQVATRFLPKLFQVERFSVFLYRVHRRQLALFAHNHPEWDEAGFKVVLPLESGNQFMADAIATRAPVVVSSFSASRYANERNAGRYPEGPAMCVPLEADGQVIGVLNLNGIRAGDIAGGYLGMVKQAASHFALALYNTQLVARINEQAIRDPLTGLFNRRHLYHCAGRMAEEATRHGTVFSLLLLDVDGFKTMNDTWGHATGDRLLKNLAEEVKMTLRRSDTACRIGGDEFVVLLADTGGDEAASFAQRLRARLDGRHPPADAPKARLTVSIGIAESRPGEGYDGLLRRADEALYEAKRRGRDTWVLAAGRPAGVLPKPALG